MTERINVECEDCKGTGLYIGFAERNGAAAVCRTCDGTGCTEFEYTVFTKRRVRKGIKRVYQYNPGFGIGEKLGVCTLEDFGGMPYKDWLKGKEFPPGSEMRKYVCPTWWYQSADYKRKPDWKECWDCNSFRECSRFKKKEKCWERFDEENK